MKRFVGLVAVVCAVACAWLSRPVRWEVEGLSMAPGLLPGDVAESAAFALLDDRRGPHRFERWALLGPDGQMVVKRVWGLPGEEIGIIDGEIAVDGGVIVKPPCVLADVALPVVPEVCEVTASRAVVVLPDAVFDDMPFAPDEHRVLVPVHDVGVAVVIDVDERNRGERAASVEIRVADRTVGMWPGCPGRCVAVAGRLDGAFVATAWPMQGKTDSRSVLPAGTTAAWAVQSTWSRREPVTSIEIRVVAPAARRDGIVIADVIAWRDVHQLCPASGTPQWHLGPAECFVLGDFPGGSRDSRHWGGIDVARLRHRIAVRHPH